MKPGRHPTAALLLLGTAAAICGIWFRGPAGERGARSGEKPRGAVAMDAEDLGPEGHNCRFWALVGRDYPPALLDEHLIGAGHTTLRSLGGFNRDGWGFAAYPAGGELRSVLDGPLVRRGRPPSDNPTDPNFVRAVGELRRMSPRAILGHVRTGTSGHWGIPDPHPFLQRGLAFAHNGAVSITAAEELIDAEMPGYLDANPPEYVRGNVDSEIYFLWLLCHADAHRELNFTEAIREAVELLRARVAPSRLNFVMTRGDTLWALRCSELDAVDPVRYFPDDNPTSAFWVVASQPVGAEGSRWANIPPMSLGVFVPGSPPAFYPVAPDSAASYSIRSIRVGCDLDADGDGYCCAFTVHGRADASFGRHPVRLRVLAREEEETRLLAESDSVEIQAGGAESFAVRVEVTPPGLAATRWDLQVDLVALGAEPRTVATAGPDADPAWGLAGLRVEGGDQDHEAPTTTDAVGGPRPNPARGSVLIPVRLPAPASSVSLQIWDARGALIREETAADIQTSARGTNEVEGAISWDGRTSTGRRAPAGVYFARVRTGGWIREHRIVLAR